MKTKTNFLLEKATPIIMMFVIRRMVKVALAPILEVIETFKAVGGPKGLIHQLKAAYMKYKGDDEHANVLLLKD